MRMCILYVRVLGHLALRQRVCLGTAGRTEKGEVCIRRVDACRHSPLEIREVGAVESSRSEAASQKQSVQPGGEATVRRSLLF